MTINPAVFREYDIRGVAGQDYDESFVATLGRAYATKLAAEGISRAAVSRDCRLTSPLYHETLKAALRQGGIDVIDIGQCPTPLMYFAVNYLDLMAGVQVTGSHNPPDHNGFKICIGKATIHGEAIQELRALMEAGQFVNGGAGGGSEEAYPIIPAYQDYVADGLGRCGEGLNVIVDSGNGTGGPVAPDLYRELGCEVTDLFSEPDGSFPNHHPDPVVLENVEDLARTVTGDKADFGIAFDGDADRIGVVDEHGQIVWGDELLVLFARDVLAKNPGATVVSEVKCSQRLYDDIEARGGQAVMWKAGHSLLKAKMRETGALLGGEMSGHLFFGDRYFGFDDAIYAGARMIELVAASGSSVRELLSDLPECHATPEIRVDCPDDVKFELARRACERFRELGYDIVDVDGVRVKFDDGWGLVRASNTQPVLVMRFEAREAANLDRYRSLVEEELAGLRSQLEQG